MKDQMDVSYSALNEFIAKPVVLIIIALVMAVILALLGGVQ